MFTYLFIILSFINPINADIVQEPVFTPPENYISENNLIGMWALSVCSCVGLLHKNRNPINIEYTDEEYDDKSYQKITLKEGKSLNKLKKDLNEIKKAIEYLEKLEIDKEKKEKNIETYIPNSIKYKFGNGEIRSKKNGKYYHGIIGNEDKYKFGQRWWVEDIYDNHFLHFTNPNTKLPHTEWDTHDPHDFCNNCFKDLEHPWNANRRKNFIYRCNGHEI